jgi:fatty acid synthase subunit alpha
LTLKNYRIHGVVAFTHTANDKNGRSIPAPGAGLLTSVIESQSKYPSPLLSMPYRKRNLSIRLREIDERRDCELSYLQEQVKPDSDLSYVEEEMRNVESAAARQRKEALNTFGNFFWKGDARIAPLRGALATWGLTIDDIGVASFHGTSTKKNEANESRIINEQMARLGRKAGNPLLGVFQKSLTGHPKGAAAAWMLNGCLQIMDTGLVPGNRNADNIDADLAQYDHITYPNRSIQTTGVDAFSITSFGFGQKGGQAVGVHPKFLFAALEEHEYAAYEKKRSARHAKAYRHFHQGLVTNKVFVPKDVGPYPEAEAFAYLTNPHARVPL